MRLMHMIPRAYATLGGGRLLIALVVLGEVAWSIAQAIHFDELHTQVWAAAMAALLLLVLGGYLHAGYLGRTALQLARRHGDTIADLQLTITAQQDAIAVQSEAIEAQRATIAAQAETITNFGRIDRLITGEDSGAQV